MNAQGLGTFKGLELLEQTTDVVPCRVNHQEYQQHQTYLLGHFP
jgi:hypothetical protein